MKKRKMPDWKIFRGEGEPHNDIKRLPPPPDWRTFSGEVERERALLGENDPPSEKLTARGKTFQCEPSVDEKVVSVVEVVNAALYLRRPLLLTGKPGAGKSSLIYRVAYELKLGDVLEWPITSKTTLKSGLYDYDAIGRFQDFQMEKKKLDIGKYLKLGPLGLALLPTERPRALLIDEIDKSDLDFPNELLNIFENGEFRIPELERMDDPEEKGFEIGGVDGGEKFPIRNGHVRCRQFPFVVMTSNGERDFPAPFLRRCLQFDMPNPNQSLLEQVVSAHLGEEILAQARPMIQDFLTLRDKGELATDQLLNALYLVRGNHGMSSEAEKDRLKKILWKALTAR
jgi:MoxR-like ATPase